MEVYKRVEHITPVQLAMNTASSVFECVGGDKGSVHVLTCELQRAAQRAVSWGQQRQAGVFRVWILQTLHQGDGRVLDKLHQQLWRESREAISWCLDFKWQLWFFASAMRADHATENITSGLESSSSESIGHPVWNPLNDSIATFHEISHDRFKSIWRYITSNLTG